MSEHDSTCAPEPSQQTCACGCGRPRRKVSEYSATCHARMYRHTERGRAVCKEACRKARLKKRKSDSPVAVRSTMERHGFSPRGAVHPLLSVRAGMLRRCGDSSNKQYKDYGGRGIYVCDEWLKSPGEFVRWGMANGWQVGLQIDRIDNDGPYAPWNCRFVTALVNSKNKRPKKIQYTSMMLLESLREEPQTLRQIAERGVGRPRVLESARALMLSLKRKGLVERGPGNKWRCVS